MQQPANMQGKVALVTGAASGVGRAVANKFAAAGAGVYLVDINGDGLADVVKEVGERGVTAVARPADLAEPGICPAIVDSAVAEFGRLDALCNVAGVMLPCHSTAMAPEDFHKTLSINLAAPFFLIQAAIPHLIATRGAVVNVASAVGITAQAYTAAYCASKAGLIHMTKSLAMEYIHQPIRINAVAPGGMMTPLAMAMTTLKDPDPSVATRTNPLRGLVDIDEVADMVAYLGSDAARGYHGSCVVIDAGMTAG